MRIKVIDKSEGVLVPVKGAERWNRFLSNVWWYDWAVRRDGMAYTRVSSLKLLVRCSQ